VRGDLDTPVTETVDGESSLIMDCRVHDRLLFQVPADLPAATYSVSVIVPNITGIDFWGDSLSSDPEFIKVVPPSTARFTVASETLHAQDETAPSWAGSDEVGLRFLAVALLADRTAVASDPESVQLGKRRLRRHPRHPPQDLRPRAAARRADADSDRPRGG
jgi:hypothetical protein